MSALRTVAASCLATILLAAGPVMAEPVYGITSTSTFNFPALVSFDSATPGVMSNPIAISGLVGGQTLRSIDFRPANGSLYAVSSSGAQAQLYTVNLATGVLTTVGSGFTLTGNTSSAVTIDFNPVVDRLRVITGDGQNYRVNPITGALVMQDTSLPSPNAANGVQILGIAYSNNVAGAASTTLYGYDYLNDNLDTIGNVGGTPSSPNAGTTFVVGSTGLLSDTEIGLDISGVTGFAYASVFDYDSGATNGFHRVDLGTGLFSLIGYEAFALRDFSVRTAAVAAVVPEPDSLAMIGIGLAALAVTLRRRTRRA